MIGLISLLNKPAMELTTVDKAILHLWEIGLIVLLCVVAIVIYELISWWEKRK